MKTLAGVTASLAVALGLALWGLSRSLAEVSAANERVAQLEASVRKAERESNLWVERMDAFDTAIGRLNASTEKNHADLKIRLDAIRSVTKQPGDTDESISCLDVRIPAQLIDGLR